MFFFFLAHIENILGMEEKEAQGEGQAKEG